MDFAGSLKGNIVLTNSKRNQTGRDWDPLHAESAKGGTIGQGRLSSVYVVVKQSCYFSPKYHFLIKGAFEICLLR